MAYFDDGLLHVVGVIGGKVMKYVWGKVKNNIGFCVLLLLWIFEFVINIVYVKKFFLVHSMNSDYAGDAVFARHLADSGNYIFSLDWFPTTELYVVHHQLIMVPLFKIFNDYNTVWLLTSIIAFVLVSLSLFFFMKCMEGSNNRSFFAVVLFLSPINGFVLDFSIWFHGYLFYYIMAFLVLGIIFKYLKKSKLNKIDIGLNVIISFLCGICGVRMFMIVHVPLMIAFVITFCGCEIKKLWNSFSQMLMISVVGSLIGFAVHAFVLGPRYGSGSVMVSNTILRDSETIKNNVLFLPKLIFDGFGIDFNNRGISIHTIFIAIKAFFWFYVVIVTVYSLRNKRLEGELAYSCIIVNILLMVLTFTNDHIVGASRYFSLSTFMLIPVFALDVPFQNKYLSDYVSHGIIGISCIAVLWWGKNTIDTCVSGEAISWRQPYIDFLVDNDYSFGAATYWNANITIFLSNATVQVKPVYNDPQLSFMEWNTQKSFKDRTPEFVLLTLDEYNIWKSYGNEHSVLYEDSYVVILSFNTAL